MSVGQSKHLRNLTLAFVAAGMLAGCTSSTREVEAWVDEVRARPAPPLDPLPVMKQFESFEYSPVGLRDPFSLPEPDRNDNGKGPDPNRRKEALEAFPLDALDMVGTIGAGGGQIGLVIRLHACGDALELECATQRGDAFVLKVHSRTSSSSL